MPFPTSSVRAAVVERLRTAGCVFAEEEAALLIEAARTPSDLDDLVRRRADGDPLEQVLGWAEFCDLRISMAPGVFVPRKRSELLVEQAATLAPLHPPHVAAGSGPGVPPHSVLRVVELCCGSGAISLALADALRRRTPPPERIEVHAVDLDPAAVRCARRNLTEIGALVHEGDLFAPLPAGLRGRVDLLVANTPYVPTDQVAMLPPEARLHEPRLSLDGGPDGLDLLRLICAAAAGWLAPRGHLLIEISERQAPAALAAFRAGELEPWLAEDGERGATVIIGRR